MFITFKIHFHHSFVQNIAKYIPPTRMASFCAIIYHKDARLLEILMNNMFFLSLSYLELLLYVCFFIFNNHIVVEAFEKVAPHNFFLLKILILHENFLQIC